MRKTILCLSAAAAAFFTAPSAQAASASGDPVLYWNQVLIGALPASPLLASRHAAILNTALHDAVNAAQGGPNQGYLGAANPNAGDTRAAAAAAAYTVLKTLYGDRPAFQDAYAQSLAQVASGAAKDAGIASGQGYANQILALRATDGFNASVPYTPSGEIGRYAYTPNSPQSAAGTQWGAVTPFVMTSGDQFRPGAPPTLDSAAYAAAVNEVRLLGASDSVLRTADMAQASLYWVDASGPAPWLQMAINSAEAQGSGVVANASVFARLSTSIMDSTIAIFDAKYTYDYWRPVTAIRNGDLDGNALTIGDANWSPFIVTPNHPSYVSGHSAIAAAGAAILANAFGDSGGICLDWAGRNRCWSSFTATAQEAADSRLWGGIHYSFDNQAGLAMGRSVAGFTLSSAVFGGVPEPESWALLIVGFGAVGAHLRRRAATIRRARMEFA